MRTLALILAIVCAVALSSAPPTSAQESAWTKIYHAPTSYVQAIDMFDDRLGLASTLTGILRTTDGGSTWAELESGIASGSAQRFAFFDAQRAWAAGGTIGLARSDDGGLTWLPVQRDGARINATSIAVVSHDEVWVTAREPIDQPLPGPQPPAIPTPSSPPQTEANSTPGPVAYDGSILLRTLDGGATWQQVTPFAEYEIMDSVTFIREDGWVTASPCKPGQHFFDCPRHRRALLRTDDGGETWDVINAEPDFAPRTVAFVDAHLGYGTAPVCEQIICDRQIWRTGDGGETWKELASPTDSQQIRIAPNGDVWIEEYKCTVDACTESIWRSETRGEEWEQLLLDYYPVTFDVTSTHAVVPSRTDGISRYDLARETWSAAETPLEPAFWEVAFEPQSDTIGYAAGFDAFRRTRDGGRSWERVAQPAQLSRLQPVGGGLLWATADAACNTCPTVYRSTDGANSWTPLDGPWWFISTFQAADSTRAWAVADNGLWRTDDAGVTWLLLEEGNSAGNYHFVGRDFGYSTTCGIYRCEESFRVTDDGGVTWEPRPMPMQDGLTFVTPDVGFAMRYEGNTECPCTFPLMGTTDGGRTWTDLTRLHTHLMNFTFIDARTGWATGGGTDRERSHVYHTTDGGRTWTIDLSLPVNSYPMDLALHGETLTLRAGMGAVQGLDDHAYLYERNVDLTPTPPVTPPDAGTGPQQPTGAPHLLAALTLTLTAAALAVAALHHRRTLSP